MTTTAQIYCVKYKAKTDNNEIEAQRKDNAAGRHPPVKKSFDDLDAEDQDESMEAAEVPPSLQPYFEAEERRQNRG